MEVLDISKRFGPVVALRGVSLSLRQGEVLGLVGDNGAGKSTLISIISGVARPDSGQIRLNGQPWAETGARTIREAGIETIRVSEIQFRREPDAIATNVATLLARRPLDPGGGAA